MAIGIGLNGWDDDEWSAPTVIERDTAETQEIKRILRKLIAQNDGDYGIFWRQGVLSNSEKKKFNRWVKS